MKTLKYILFSILLSLVFINYVNAEEVCNFGNDVLKFTCRIDSNDKVSCKYAGNDKNATLKEYNFFKEDVIICDKAKVFSTFEGNKNYFYLYSKNAEIPKKIGIQEITALEIVGQKIDLESNADKLSKYNGKSCSYNLADLQYKCVIENGKPNCKLSYVNNIPNSSFTIDNNSINVLTAKDFLNGDNFVCPLGDSNALHICGTKQGNINNVNYVGKSCGGLTDFGLLTNNSSSSNNNGGGNTSNPSGGNTTNPSNPSNPSGGNSTNPSDPSNPSDDAPTEYNPASFCTRNEVKGAFRVLGWAIYIIKIVIPILLIVLGSIDVAKAVIASKDDELKKSLKTLGMRVAAGIIVFFIPTLIDFIVTIFNGDSIYDSNSGFGYCTHCILKPTDDACGSLMGGN